MPGSSVTIDGLVESAHTFRLLAPMRALINRMLRAFDVPVACCDDRDAVLTPLEQR